MTESIITKLICANQGALEFGELVDIGSGLQDLKGVFETVLGNGELFSVVKLNGKKRVLAKTKVRLCKNKECRGCFNLHLCKHFLYGRCKNGVNQGETCTACEDLSSAHNTAVLRENGLLQLSRTELCTLLLQNDDTLLPPVCLIYNKGPGVYGFCPKKESCQRLHICTRYIAGSCNPELDCPKSHDFFEPQPMEILRVADVPEELIGSLLHAYQNLHAITKKDGTMNTEQETGASQSTSRSTRGKGRDQGSGKSNICVFFVKGSCKNGDKCPRTHFNWPYKWEVRSGSSWSALPDNVGIEKDFCNPVNTYSQGPDPVCFDTMTQGLSKVRRLSTVSSVVLPGHIWTTEWVWYWQNDHGNWIQYSSTGGLHQSLISSHSLEKTYLENQSGFVRLTSDSVTYEFNFKEMIQTKCGSTSHVRRRPVFVSSKGDRSKKVPNSLSQNIKSAPGLWDKTLGPDAGYKMVTACQHSTSKYTENLFKYTGATWFSPAAVASPSAHRLSLLGVPRPPSTVPRPPSTVAMVRQTLPPLSSSLMISVPTQTKPPQSFSVGITNLLQAPPPPRSFFLISPTVQDPPPPRSFSLISQPMQTPPPSTSSSLILLPKQAPPTATSSSLISLPRQAPPPSTSSSLILLPRQAPPPSTSSSLISLPMQAPPPSTSSSLISQPLQTPSPSGISSVISRPIQSIPKPHTTSMPINPELPNIASSSLSPSDIADTVSNTNFYQSHNKESSTGEFSASTLIFPSSQISPTNSPSSPSQIEPIIALSQQNAHHFGSSQLLNLSDACSDQPISQSANQNNGNVKNEEKCTVL